VVRVWIRPLSLPLLDVGMHRVTIFRFVLLSIAFAVVAAGSPDDQRPAKLPPLPKEIETLVATARSAPPEIFADSIIRLVEGGKVPSIEWQKVLLQDAFTAAQQAHEPVRLIPVTGLPTDTRASFRGRAGDLQIDALSLESRVLKTLLTVDRASARQLFQAIPPIRRDAATCEDPLISDASAYYDVSGAIAQSAFEPGEKEKSVHLQFLIGVLSGASTPAELAGFGRALGAVNLSRPEMEIVAGALEAKLDALPVNYRSFALKIIEPGRPQRRRIARETQRPDRGVAGRLFESLGLKGLPGKFE